MAARNKRFTAADTAELSVLLQASLSEGATLPPATIKAAVAACKPARTPKPKPAPADKRVTTIKRISTNVTSLTERINDARRSIAANPRSLDSAMVAANLPAWKNELTVMAQTLARCVRDYFANPNPTESNDKQQTD